MKQLTVRYVNVAILQIMKPHLHGMTRGSANVLLLASVVDTILVRQCLLIVINDFING